MVGGGVSSLAYSSIEVVGAQSTWGEIGLGDFGVSGDSIEGGLGDLKDVGVGRDYVATCLYLFEGGVPTRRDSLSGLGALGLEVRLTSTEGWTRPSIAGRRVMHL